VRALALALLLGACAAGPPAPAACPAGTQPATIAEAFFGRSAAGREVVGDADWARFMDEVVTPAFPDGLSVLDAAGQWRGRGGSIARERSKLLVVAMPGADAAQASARMEPVRAAYRERFRQESVMLAVSGGCVGF
jgi:hypothetical protein